jgi:Uma2 family endonuclease
LRDPVDIVYFELQCHLRKPSLLVTSSTMATAPKLPPHSTPISPQDYFAWEAEQELRYEYFDGQVFAMTGGTVAHGLIGLNLAAAIKTHLRGRGCLTLNSDCKIGISEAGPFVYPDVSVTCDARDRSAKQFSRYPCLIIEVLSPATEAYDRGGKFSLYRRLETLQEYVLVGSETKSVEVFRHNPEGIWQFIPYSEEQLVELTSIGLNLSFETIYEDVTLSESPTGSAG